MNETALVLIDLQNDYFEGGANTLVNSYQAVMNAKQILNHFRKKEGHIFHVQHIATSPGATFFLPSTKGADINENVAPLIAENLIVKHYPNSFRETTLLTELRAMNISNLVVCGMMTHMCVDATIRAAKDFGFTITLIEDACATKDLVFRANTMKATEVHFAFISALNGVYARILNSAEFIAA